jgi:maleamate amidohydrolase
VDWEKVIPAEDLAVYSAAGYGARSQPGSHPALIVIDLTWGFIGREPLPVLESVQSYPNSCGERGWAALEAINAVASKCREKALPIFYTAGMSEDREEHAGRWRDKHPRTLEQPVDAYDLVDEELLGAEGILVRKAKPSAFFGTPLIASLIDHRVDTLIVTGCTTSGCVRASVVDAFSYGLNIIVVEDGVFDRGEVSHVVNLFDMDQKYANVQTSEDVLRYLDALT